MWIVIKYKKKELGLLKEELKKLIGEIPNLYIPKIKIQKIDKKKNNLYKTRFIKRLLVLLS